MQKKLRMCECVGVQTMLRLILCPVRIRSRDMYIVIEARQNPVTQDELKSVLPRLTPEQESLSDPRDGGSFRPIEMKYTTSADYDHFVPVALWVWAAGGPPFPEVVEMLSMVCVWFVVQLCVCVCMCHGCDYIHLFGACVSRLCERGSDRYQADPPPLLRSGGSQGVLKPLSIHGGS